MEERKSRFTTEVEKAKWREETYQQCKAELLARPAVQKLKEVYNTSSFDDFIKEYTSKKVSVLEYGKFFKEKAENAQTQWIDEAYDRLKEIQHKKLFDLQCQWRAGNIKLEGVDITEDFSWMSDNIMNCPCISPIAEDEVELYLKYLGSSNFDNNIEYRWYDFQDYDEIKEAYNDDDASINYPEYYSFHDSMRGTSIYLSLPDSRGERELFYRQLAEGNYVETHPVEVKEKEEAQKLHVASLDNRPLLHTTREMIAYFVRTFEDKETQDNMNLVYSTYNETSASNEDYYDDKLFEETEEMIPIEAWHNWKEALQRAANKYRAAKIAEALPLAYDTYLLRLNSSIPFERNDRHPTDDASEERWKQKIIADIIKGRVLNGEPPDLDF